MVIFIDTFGNETTEEKSAYKIKLDGSYKYSILSKCWEYGVDKRKSTLQISLFISNNRYFTE